MKKINYIFICLLALATIFQGCKKEDDAKIEPAPITPAPETFTCIPFETYDLSNCWLGPQYRKKGTFYQMPCFNPNNSNEFLYVRSSSIYKYNLLSKQSTMIAERVQPVGPPDWSRSGWIVFSDISWKIWKIRDDGTGLQQLSFGEDDQFPYFNPAGDKIIYGSHFLNTNKMLIMDLNGNKLDTLCSLRLGSCLGWGNSSWTVNDRILRRTHSGQGMDGELSFYNYATKQDESPLFTYKNDSSNQEIRDYKVLNADKILYAMTNKGLVLYNIQAKTHQVLKENCHNIWYDFFSISPDKTKLLVEKNTLKFVGDCTFEQRKSLVIMNIDGSNEQEIPLP
ncbi:hypothetical protein I5M27_01050 [Adhaeribacter sp. BT258]|uniref:WD40-like Beta Propeller Repeat n=1 Tax=Adhaeribacter terrigena TaxID=2793070 RepID=A0ABS1BWX3_9BACT|nr:hypothetical protein [Adhaeribacter terrigena]MBK0401549.1 hypothetical protein [Adhaeribacter terrigena]